MKVIGLAGYTCSGKSTASEYLSAHGWYKVDIGETIRQTHKAHFAKENIMDFTLRSHQIFGNSWSILKGLSQIESDTKNVVIAGIRFTDQIKLLKQISSDFVLLHISSDLQNRETRFLTRKRDDTLSFQMSLNDKDEYERKHYDTDRVIEQCSLEIKNNNSIIEFKSTLGRIVESAF